MSGCSVGLACFVLRCISVNDIASFSEASLAGETAFSSVEGAVQSLQRQRIAPSTDENAVSPAKDASLNEAMTFTDMQRSTKHAKPSLQALTRPQLIAESRVDSDSHIPCVRPSMNVANRGDQPVASSVALLTR